MLKRLVVVTTTLLLRSRTDGVRLVPKLGRQLGKGRAVKEVEIKGKWVDMGFGDQRYRFHAAWLRDACRDESHVASKAGERLLTATPVGPLGHIDPSTLEATGFELVDDGEIVVLEWNGGTRRESRFLASDLLRYAEKGVALQISSGQVPPKTAQKDDPDWLAPFSGEPHAPAPGDVYARFDSKTENFPPKFRHSDLLRGGPILIELHRAVITQGAVLIEEVPPVDDNGPASELESVVRLACGGLQKDPVRSEANWKIVQKKTSASVSYDPAKMLYLHTDASVPPHGVPGLLLAMHYQRGVGTNTLTDGFAVANDLKKNKPEAFNMLTKYGVDAERDFAASRVDAPQHIAQGLVINRKHPVFHLSKKGLLTRIQYNEVFRYPSTVPFHDFPAWFDALSTFVSMIHHPKYQVDLDMTAGTMLLINNWRTLHGRARGRASSDRVLVGGTVTREAFYSTAKQTLLSHTTRS